MNGVHDTQVPSAELKIGDETFSLCFTFDAIAEAKSILRRLGIRCNLLLALDALEVDADIMPALLYAALRTHHAEIDYKSAKGMLNMHTAHPIFSALCDAYVKSVQRPKDEQAAEVPPTESKD